MGFGGQRSDQPQAALGAGEDSHHPGSALDLLIEALQRIGTFHMLMVRSRKPVEGQSLADVARSCSAALLAWLATASLRSGSCMHRLSKRARRNNLFFLRETSLSARREMLRDSFPVRSITRRSESAANRRRIVQVFHCANSRCSDVRLDAEPTPKFLRLSTVTMRSRHCLRKGGEIAHAPESEIFLGGVIGELRACFAAQTKGPQKYYRSRLT